MRLKQKIISYIGIDKAIFYTLLSRGLQILTALVSIIFIARFLSSDEQGYYYTFGSIVAIQVFFELGLTGIITQFVAHEFSHLSISDNYELIGDNKYKSRLSSLLHFCIKWYSIFAVILLVALVIIGFYFFSKYSDSNVDVTWKLPWFLLAVGTAFNLLLAPILSFIEGLGKVAEVAQIRLVQQCIFPIVIWGGLWFGAKLFVLGADAIIRVVVVSIILFKSPFFYLLKNIWNNLGSYKILYVKEIFPYQWRIAVSWISGYFIFQLFNPVLFLSEGPKVAGQMGMTLSALNGLQALALSWINTKVPQLSQLIALRDFIRLDRLFNKTMKQMLCIGFSFLFIFVLAIGLIQYYNISLCGINIGERFLSLIPIGIMAIATSTMFPINGWAVYLRCHKKEPLLTNSLVIGILCCLSTLILGTYYGLMGMIIGFLGLRLISLYWIHKVFINKKKQWHAKSFNNNNSDI